MRTDIGEANSTAIQEHQRQLDALRGSPEGLLEIEAIFRKTVLLAGEFIPPGLPVDDMFSDIIDVEFMPP